jgi:NAD(P) transhydrogenase subunit alpha
MGNTNLAGDLAGNASSLYARNLYAFIDLMIDKEKKGQLAIDWEDDVIKGTLVARDGKLVHPMLTAKKAKTGKGGKK